MTSLSVLAEYRFVGKSEQAIREEWIRPLLVHLGYGIETLNDIVYEQQLDLASPFRRIGRTRIKLDYRPTVLGHGLWIIEAKAHGSEDWEDAISQAWLYATHPEVDVPFMAIADGSRITVHDTYAVAWDKPVLDVTTPDLARAFPQIAAILGADNVTRAVRARRMRHIGLAMRAEVSEGRLRDYVYEVEQLARDARPAVIENQAAILRDQFDTEERRQAELVASHGLFVIGVWANSVTGGAKRLSGMARDHLLAAAPGARMAEMARLRDAARHPSGSDARGEPRMFWGLRHLELFVALSLRGEPGCEPLDAVARQHVRDHILNFPEDEVSRAARRLERVLPVFVARSALAEPNVDLPRAAMAVQSHWSDETRLRMRMSADRLFVDMVIEQARQIWLKVPWTAHSLNEVAAALEIGLPTLIENPVVRGPAGDPYFDSAYERDMLQMAALFETGDLIAPDLLDDEIVEALGDLAATASDRRRIAEPAQRLVDRYRALR